MKIIDAHIHLTSDGKWFGTGLDASVLRAISEMDEAQVGHAVLIPLPDLDNRNFCFKTADSYPDRFAVGFTLVDSSLCELANFKECLSEGICRFLKIHPRLTGITPLSECLVPFYELCLINELPVIFDTYVRGIKAPMSDIEPLIYDQLARKYPQMEIVLAHAGGHHVLDALAVAQTHPNVYLEVSHVLKYFEGSSVLQDIVFAMNKIDRKLIFGTDFPEYPIPDYLDSARGLIEKLEGFDAEGFWWRNAAKIYRIEL